MARSMKRRNSKKKSSPKKARKQRTRRSRLFRAATDVVAFGSERPVVKVLSTHENLISAGEYCVDTQYDAASGTYNARIINCPGFNVPMFHKLLTISEMPVEDFRRYLQADATGGAFPDNDNVADLNSLQIVTNAGNASIKNDMKLVIINAVSPGDHPTNREINGFLTAINPTDELVQAFLRDAAVP